MMLCSLTETLGLGLVLPLLQLITKSENSVEFGGFLRDLLKSFPENHALLIIGTGMVSLIIVKNLLFIMKTGMASLFVNRLRKDWTLEILNKYLHAHLKFHINHKQGVLLNNMIREPSVAAKAVHNMIEFFSQVILFCFLYGLALLVSWRITLIMSAAGGLLLAAVFKLTHNYASSVGRTQLELNQQTTGLGVETLSGIRQVKLFALQKRIYERFGTLLTRLVQVIAKYTVVINLPRPVIESLFVVTFVAGLFYLHYIIHAELYAFIPVIGLFVVIAQRLFPTTSLIFSSRMNIHAYLPSLKIVSQLNVVGVQTEDVGEGESIEKLDTDIVFDHVRFGYNDGKPVFEDLMLTIPNGCLTAIVGPSGSGKSTIADLIAGFYRVDAGQVLVNSIDLTKLNLSKWRSLIGYVTQDDYLFNISIRDNILMGKIEATESEVIEAARMANADVFINDFPNGYDTICVERGLNLSGGQRQRIAVARALIRNPALLIFDEATSALDMESERLIQETIQKLKGQKTMLVITHRLSSAESADLIHVLDDGRIVESGNYADLCRQRSRLFQMSRGKTR